MKGWPIKKRQQLKMPSEKWCIVVSRAKYYHTIQKNYNTEIMCCIVNENEVKSAVNDVTDIKQRFMAEGKVMLWVTHRASGLYRHKPTREEEIEFVSSALAGTL